MGDGGGGPYINIIVRQVTVAPISAHVGDVIRVDMVVENNGDLGSDYANIELLANGRRVGSKMYNYGFGGEGERIHRAIFFWDTKGTSPGSTGSAAKYSSGATRLRSTISSTWSGPWFSLRPAPRSRPVKQAEALP